MASDNMAREARRSRERAGSVAAIRSRRRANGRSPAAPYVLEISTVFPRIPLRFGEPPESGALAACGLRRPLENLLRVLGFRIPGAAGGRMEWGKQRRPPRYTH